jgi:hypothetical protein
MTDALNQFQTITLEEMKSVRLMNRIDTKYVTTTDVLDRLLEAAGTAYRVQVIDGCRNMPYYTMYFDTDQYAMYMAHLHGKKRRQKIRLRKYASGVSFLEVKRKNNKGRTDKARIECKSFDDANAADFITNNSMYNYTSLHKSIENRFNRITLVNNELTERVTIDTNLRFHNFHTDECCEMADIVIIELKRDGRCKSTLLDILRNLRVNEGSFSKYCMGMALTDYNLKHNRFKPNLRKLSKKSNILIYSNNETTTKQHK